ncbi:hypothetical protein [Thermaurantiacus tibetensis]|uniref:hypothetical protein n=1 Tax=Thermaurantiacus tibetensis TaxID=2759035 RepID=UPI001A9CA694|nr:hypothetical protein [Thermaurantiacus tibetensis]
MDTSMRETRGPSGRTALLVWLVGLALGVAAGVGTAKLLLPARDGGVLPEGQSIRDRLFGD